MKITENDILNIIKKNDVINELKNKFTGDFPKLNEQNIIGKGKDGTIYSLNNYVAKSINNNEMICYISDNLVKDCSTFINEILIHLILSTLKHPNIIELSNIIYDNKTNKFLIIMENSQYTFLLPDIIQFSTKFNISRKDIIDEVIRQIIYIISTLQDKYQFMHIDLQPKNIMFDHYPSKKSINYTVDNKKIKYTPKQPIIVKLIDFGTSFINDFRGFKIFRYRKNEEVSNRQKKYQDKDNKDYSKLSFREINSRRKLFYYNLFTNFNPYFDLDLFIHSLKDINYSDNIITNSKNYLPKDLIKLF
jgi:hypothetical protein